VGLVMIWQREQQGLDPHFHLPFAIPQELDVVENHIL